MYREPAVFPRILVVRHRLGKIEVVGTFDGPRASDQAIDLRDRISFSFRHRDETYEVWTAEKYTERTGLVW